MTVCMDRLRLTITETHHSCPLMAYAAYIVCRGRYKLLTGQHDTETTAGQTQQLLIVLSAMDVIWFVWHIVSVDSMNSWASISRAEIVLLNSWMPVQQITYHLLRVYVKTERLTESTNNYGAGTLSNYHMKTLMLWASEMKPRLRWTENLNIVRICAELLHTLSVWLTDTRCPHYFIRNCNLLDNSNSVRSVASKLMPLEKCLSMWLVNNYIKQCVQLCPDNVSRLFNDVCSNTKLQTAVSEIVRWRLSHSLYELWHTFFSAEFQISSCVKSFSLTARSCVCWMNELTKIDKRLSVYFSAVALLHVACKILRNGFRDKMMDILATVLGPDLIHCSGALSQCKSEQNTSELIVLLHEFAVEHMTTYRQLMARDFGSVVTIVATDFEALYAYKRSEYQQCLQLSTQNVYTLLVQPHSTFTPEVPTFPEFIQLMDDDIVSLTALTMPAHPKSEIICNVSVCVEQLTLSLYLMAQCQLKLHHSVTSLTQTLDYIKVAQSRIPRERMLEHLTLKLIQRKVQLAALWYTRTARMTSWYFRLLHRLQRFCNFKPFSLTHCNKCTVANV